MDWCNLVRLAAMPQMCQLIVTKPRVIMNEVEEQKEYSCPMVTHFTFVCVEYPDVEYDQVIPALWDYLVKDPLSHLRFLKVDTRVIQNLPEEFADFPQWLSKISLERVEMMFQSSQYDEEMLLKFVQLFDGQKMKLVADIRNKELALVPVFKNFVEIDLQHANYTSMDWKDLTEHWKVVMARTQEKRLKKDGGSSERLQEVVTLKVDVDWESLLEHHEDLMQLHGIFELGQVLIYFFGEVRIRFVTRVALCDEQVLNLQTQQGLRISFVGFLARMCNVKYEGEVKKKYFVEFRWNSFGFFVRFFQ